MAKITEYPYVWNAYMKLSNDSGGYKPESYYLEIPWDDQPAELLEEMTKSLKTPT